MDLTLVWRSDAHNSDQPPQSRTDDWTATVLDKLTQVGEVARKVGAVGVLDGGDLFHTKSPSRNSHELVQRVAAVHRGYPCPTWATVGNHDVKHGSLDYLGESPLGVLFETGAVRRLYDTFEAVFERPLVDWSVGGGGPIPPPFKVRVVGVPYHGTTYDMNRLTTITKGDEDYLVVVAHLLATGDKGGWAHCEKEDVLQYGDLVNYDPDLWLFGHSHKDQGVRVLGGKTFVNLGSLTRGSLNQDDIARTPKMAVLRFTKKGIHVEEVPLSFRPAVEVLDIAGKTRAEGRAATMEVFVDNLQKTLAPTEGKSLLDEVREANVPEEIRERTLHYLEQAGAR